MFPSRVIIPPSGDVPSQEDIFSSALSTLFTDDTQNSHGIPGQSVIYHSPRFGEIILKVPAHPDVEEGRKLFAHYLWNAGVVTAAAIEDASCDTNADDGTAVEESKDSSSRQYARTWEKKFWDVRGQHVLELGAGTALPSLISALCDASSISITDHPSSPAIVNDTAAANVAANLFPPTQDGQSKPRTTAKISVYGYTWGQTVFHSPSAYGKLSSSQPLPKSFNKIVIADCLWMASQHVNLVKTILAYLAESPASDSANQPCNCALVVAGFHTGRRIVSNFFRIATGSRSAGAEAGDRDDSDEEDDKAILAVKGALHAASIFEVDVDCNIRPWQALRPGENKDQTKRWCVCAALVRR